MEIRVEEHLKFGNLTYKSLVYSSLQPTAEVMTSSTRFLVLNDCFSMSLHIFSDFSFPPDTPYSCRLLLPTLQNLIFQ